VTINVRARRALFWSLVLAAATAVLFPYRSVLDKAHIALVLLLVVLGAAARGGRVVGLYIGVASFLVFAVAFVPPYGRFAVANPLDWFVLIAFLVTSGVASQLLHRAQEANREADEERQHLEEERRRTDALRETDALKDALLASVSHDLRTPLTSIKALANQLGALGDERSQIIEEQADRLSRYVSDLLDLSRLTAGVMPVRIEVNAVDDLLSAAIEETEAHLADRPLEVKLPLDGVLLAGRFDLSLSVRIITNLIDNAHKYSPPGLPITVEALRQGNRLRIVVRDRGPGIADGEDERVFDTFYRPVSAPADRGSAGLGLALGRRMAALQDGALTYAPRPGGGSDFVLSLPAVELPPQNSAPSL
jgi:K+-sensing histidine kinase KdpD